MKRKTTFRKEDLDKLGNTPFLSCVTCKVGCVLESIHQNVTEMDLDRGLPKESVVEDSSGKILKSRPCGGCILLDDGIGCLVSQENRPIACLVCPLQIDSEGNLIANAYCPDVQKIVIGVMEKDPQICSYVAASARVMSEDDEFRERSAMFVDKYKCKVVLGNIKELVSLDKDL